MPMVQVRVGLAGALLPAAAVGGATLAWALAARAVSTAQNPALTVDAVVESTVVAIGAVAAAWVAVSCALAALCVGARSVGLTWRAGERAVQRFAPAAVRRVLGVAVATTLAATVATGAGAAQPFAGPVAAPVGQPAGQVQVADLGWVPSTAVPDRATDAAPPAVPDDLGWVPSEAAFDEPPARSDDGAPGASSTADPTGVPPSNAPSPSASPAAPGPAARASTPSAVAASRPHEATTAAARATSPTSTADSAAPDIVVVRAGDTLWGIAAEHLGRGASDRDVAAAWPAWFHANEAVIGTDPDHIEPGQRLTVPPSTTPTSNATTSTEGNHR